MSQGHSWCQVTICSSTKSLSLLALVTWVFILLSCFRSPVLKAAFVHNMVEKATGKINIDGIESNTVEDMLKYIYGGKIENLEDKATKLLAAADQYDLKLLKKKCEELLCKSLNISNCLDYLILADMHSTDILKPLVIRLVWPLASLFQTSNSGLWLRTAGRWSPKRIGKRSWWLSQMCLQRYGGTNFKLFLYWNWNIGNRGFKFYLMINMNIRFSMSWRRNRLGRSLEGILRTGGSVEQAQEVGNLVSLSQLRNSLHDSYYWSFLGGCVKLDCSGASRGSPGQSGVSRGGQALEAYFRNSLMWSAIGNFLLEVDRHSRCAPGTRLCEQSPTCKCAGVYYHVMTSHLHVDDSNLNHLASNICIKMQFVTSNVFVKVKLMTSEYS